MTPAELARLFAAEAPRLMRRLQRFNRRLAAEDVVQAAFAKMLEVDPARIGDPKAYLARIAHNLAIDEVRRQGRMGLAGADIDQLENLVGGAPSAEDALIAHERVAHMNAALAAMGEKERLALVLFKLKGLSHKEIGRRLGVSQHSVPRYLSRALAKCARAMQAFESAGLDGHDNDTGEPDRT